MNNTIWYNEPARDWNEALAIGNGKLGAMVYGRVYSEIVQLNEETLWSGYYENVENPDVKEHIPEMQKLIFNQKYAEAQKLCEKYLVCKGPGSGTGRTNGHYGSYQTAGELYIENIDASDNNYRRSLDLYNGITKTEFDGCTREYFSSYKYNVVVIKITGNTKNLRIRYNRKDIYAPSVIRNDGDTISVTGSHHDGKGENYAVFVKKVNKPFGCVIYASVATDYIDKTDPLARCKSTVDAAASVDVDEIMSEHKAYFNKYMGRATIDFNGSNRDDVPTNERLRDPYGDKDLIALYFQFGRYLLVSSSRGVLPANLQGIWCNDYTAPWNSDYHININIQMNYWPANTTNLAEFEEPFFEYIEKLSQWGREPARETYGCSGWVAHTVTNPWGFTTLGEGPSWGAFTCAGAWCCRHIWDHYLFTGDKAFIEKYYPIIKGCAEFFMDFLTKDPNNGYLVTCPSNSPENSFRDPETRKSVSMSAAPTMDNEILYELFSIVSDISEILGIDKEFAARAEEYRSQLAPIQIGKYGQIMEWMYDFDEAEPGHRHVSHLYALHPSNIITASKTPELFEACKKTLERRLSHGGGHTGWSRAWIINFFARLNNGNKVLENIEALLAKSTNNNMFDTHPPFQIDGNFGGTAGIAEMLLQSHEGFVNVLPSLPDELSSGSFNGLVARGGFEVSAKWENNTVVSCNVVSLYGNKLDILVNGKHYVLDTDKNGSYSII